MRKKLPIVGSLLFEAPVIATPDGFHTKVSAAGHVRHHLTILDHALGAFGPFRANRNLFPIAGAFSVDVVDTSEEGSATFDREKFQSLLLQLNQGCEEILVSDKDRTSPSAVATEISIRAGCDKDRVLRLLEAVQRHVGVMVIDAEGHGVLLGARHRPTPEHQESIDVDVADLKNLIRIDTTDNTYVIDASTEPDLKPGDQIKINDKGPLGEMQCIAVDAASPIPESQPNLFS